MLTPPEFPPPLWPAAQSHATVSHIFRAHRTPYAHRLPTSSRRRCPRPYPRRRKKAAALLGEGQLVVLPTETVYGIALNLKSAAARHAARQIKANAAESSPDLGSGGGAAKPAPPPAPWVLHLPHPDDLLAWVPNISFLGRRIVTKSLPGPVAFEIKLDPEAEKAARERLGGGAAADETIHDGFLTLRCPECLPTQEVLAHVLTPSPSSVPAPAPAPPSLSSPTSPRPRPRWHPPPCRHRRRPHPLPPLLHPRPHRRRIIIPSFAPASSTNASSTACADLTDPLHLFRQHLPLAHGRGPRRRASLPTAWEYHPRNSRCATSSCSPPASTPAAASRATPEAIDAVNALGGDLSSHFSRCLADGASLLRRADVIYTMTDAHREEVFESSAVRRAKDPSAGP